MNKLIELITEGDNLVGNIVFVTPPRNVIRTFDVYTIKDEERYYLWLNQSKLFLNSHFHLNPLTKEFCEFSQDITPKKHLQMVSILKSFASIYEDDEENTIDQLKELERLETEYSEIKDNEGAGVQFYAIKHFQTWYSYAIRLFYNVVGEGDADFKKFRDMDTSGNAYCLSNAYDNILANYVILKEKVKHPKQPTPTTSILLKSVNQKKDVLKKNIFISYSHCDVKYLKRLETHLKVLQMQNTEFDVWSDKKIKIGTDWKLEIENALRKASIAFVLVSTDFLASDFISRNELPPLLQKSQDDGTLIIPIIVSPCLFEDSPLSRFQAANLPEKPLSALSSTEMDQVFVDIIKQIKTM